MTTQLPHPVPPDLSSPKRRLLLTLAGSATLTSLCARFAPLLADVVHATPTARLAAVLPYSTSAAAVGRAYLQELPEHQAPDRLLDAVMQDLGGIDGLSPRALRSAVVAAVRRDFAERRTLRLRGWICSPTEARLAALTWQSRNAGRDPS